MEQKSFVRNAADKKQVKAAGQKEKFRDQNDRNDLLWVLSDIRGRRFVWGLLAPTNELSFAAGMPDVTAFNEGCRNKANQLLKSIMDARPEAYMQMSNEKKLREANEEVPQETKDDESVGS
jgi:hypothetical protein